MRKGEITKNEIIRRVAPLLNQQGYARLSMAEVVRTTGLQKGGIYNHFESKEQLAKEAFAYAAHLVLQRYADAMATGNSASDQLLAFVAAFYRFFEDPPVTGGCPLLNIAVESDDALPSLRQQASREMRKWHSCLTRVITTGMRRGEIQPQIDAKATATLLIASLEGGLMLSKLHGDPLYLQQVVKHLQDYIQQQLQRS
jgi:AcrR family transcriptional regulator